MRWRRDGELFQSLFPLISIDHTDDPSNDAAISDAHDEKRWRALLGLVTDDSLLLFLTLIMPMTQVILVTLMLLMMQIILVIF